MADLSFSVRNAISNLTVHSVCENHAAGAGSLIAATVDTVTWTAPGDSVGAAVEIANGELKLVYSDDTSLWIVVERTSTTDLSGTATVQIVTASTTATLLAETTDAISRVLQAQSTGLAGDEIRRANLATLMKLKARLEKKLAREQHTGGGVAEADLRANF